MTAPIRSLACLAAFVTASGTANAQPGSAPNRDEWLIHTWCVDEGLPDSSATAMAQTPDGYLWFGTFGGLVRFDGAAFTVFSPRNTPELPSAAIVNLHLDQQDRLWISTLAGVVVCNGAQWLDYTREPALGDDEIRTFAERANGDLLLTTFGGAVVEYRAGTFARLPDPPGEEGQGYWGGADEDGCWWVAQNQFVGRWDGQRWVPQVHSSELAGVEREWVAITPARAGGLWVLLGADLHRFTHGGKVATRSLPAPPGGVWGLSEDSEGNVWVASYRAGVYQLPPAGPPRRWTTFDGDVCTTFRFVFEDREHNLWLGTSGHGLIRLTTRRFHDFGPREGLSATVSSISLAPGGGLWVATYGQGLYRLDDTGLHPAPLSGLNEEGYVIQSVLADSRGRTWIGLYGEGLYVFDEAGEHPVPAGDRAGGNMIALFEDSLGRIWASGGKFVAVIDQEEARVLGPEDGLPIGGVVCFAEAPARTIWLSNLDGVFRVRDGRVVELLDAEGRPIPDVACLKSDRDGTMWMGSTAARVLRWRDGTLAEIGPGQGLPDAEVLSILEDGDGYFWMASSRGVIRAARADLESVADAQRARLNSQLFNARDGLPTMECSGFRQPVGVRDAKGRLWFATMKGVGMADPARFPLNPQPPPVHVERIRYRRPGDSADSPPKLDQMVSAPFPATVELPAGSRGIEIQYTALCFTAPQKIRFEVRLDGADPTWRDVGNRRAAFYDVLPAGRYRFRVRAASGDGVWSDDDASVAFVVQPFLWETGWFRGLAALAACGAALGWVYHRHVRHRRQQAQQAMFTHQLIARQEAERSRVASELHDGLGHSLLLIKSRLALAARQPETATTRQFEELAADVTRAIGEVRAVSRALRPGALAQVGLTHSLRWMIEELRTATDIEFVTELDNIDGLLAPEMEISLYRVVQEVLNNVMKHAGATYVTVEAKRSSSGISVTVEDNGCGFDWRRLRSEDRVSFGLTGITERANLLNGRVSLTSAPGMGTRVILTVPVQGRSA